MPKTTKLKAEPTETKQIKEDPVIEALQRINALERKLEQNTAILAHMIHLTGTSRVLDKHPTFKQYELTNDDMRKGR